MTTTVREAFEEHTEASKPAPATTKTPGGAHRQETQKAPLDNLGPWVSNDAGTGRLPGGPRCALLCPHVISTRSAHECGGVARQLRPI